MMQSSLTMIRPKGNLGMINKSEMVSFQIMTETNYAIYDLTCSESEFQRVGTVTEKNHEFQHEF